MHSGCECQRGFSTAKIAYYDKSVDPFRPEFNEYCIYVFWHEYMTIPVAHWSKSPITMLVSQHRDAEWLTQAGKRLQFNIVRGSTRRGGTEAIRKLRKALKSSGLGITPDGPKGPRRKMAMGPIFLASMLKMPIVPVGFGCDSPWRLSTWDRFAVPKPFSRARILFGPKIHIPRKLNRDQKEAYRGKIECLVNDLTHTAEHWAEHGLPLQRRNALRPAERLSAGNRRLRVAAPSTLPRGVTWRIG